MCQALQYRAVVQILSAATKSVVEDNKGIAVVRLNGEAVGHGICCASSKNALERVLQLSEA